MDEKTISDCSNSSGMWFKCADRQLSFSAKALPRFSLRLAMTSVPMFLLIKRLAAISIISPAPIINARFESNVANTCCASATAALAADADAGKEKAAAKAK